MAPIIIWRHTLTFVYSTALGFRNENSGSVKAYIYCSLWPNSLDLLRTFGVVEYQ